MNGLPLKAVVPLAVFYLGFIASRSWRSPLRLLLSLGMGGRALEGLERAREIVAAHPDHGQVEPVPAVVLEATARVKLASLAARSPLP